MDQNKKTGQSNLCNSCDSCVQVEFENNEEFKYCEELKIRLHKSVLNCTEYRERNQPNFYELEAIAWPVIKGKKGDMGFKKPEA